MTLASNVQKYFWEIDPQRARPKDYPEYYIRRILELGDKKAFLWLKGLFGEKKIKEVAKKEKMSKKSRNFWLKVLK